MMNSSMVVYCHYGRGIIAIICCALGILFCHGYVTACVHGLKLHYKHLFWHPGRKQLAVECLVFIMFPPWLRFVMSLYLRFALGSYYPTVSLRIENMGYVSNLVQLVL